MRPNRKARRVRRGKALFRAFDRRQQVGQCLRIVEGIEPMLFFESPGEKLCKAFVPVRPAEVMIAVRP